MATLTLTLDLSAPNRLDRRIESYDQLLEIAAKIHQSLPNEIWISREGKIDVKIIEAQLAPDHLVDEYGHAIRLPGAGR